MGESKKSDPVVEELVNRMHPLTMAYVNYAVDLLTHIELLEQSALLVELMKRGNQVGKNTWFPDRERYQSKIDRNLETASQALRAALAEWRRASKAFRQHEQKAKNN